MGTVALVLVIAVIGGVIFFMVKNSKKKPIKGGSGTGGSGSGTPTEKPSDVLTEDKTQK